MSLPAPHSDFVSILFSWHSSTRRSTGVSRSTSTPRAFETTFVIGMDGQVPDRSIVWPWYSICSGLPIAAFAALMTPSASSFMPSRSE